MNSKEVSEKVKPTEVECLSACGGTSSPHSRELLLLERNKDQVNSSLLIHPKKKVDVKTHIVQSSLLSKVKDFLPKLRAANEDLLSDAYNIENGNTDEAEQQIEISLALTEFPESDGDDRTSSTDTDSDRSEESSEDESESLKLEKYMTKKKVTSPLIEEL